MAGKLVMWLVAFGCGILFFSIGTYAQNLNKPMGFWSGMHMNTAQVRDVAQYNKENAAMWKRYSLWYFTAGVAEIQSTILAAGLLVAGGTIGLVLLIRCYNRIYQTYRIQ